MERLQPCSMDKGLDWCATCVHQLPLRKGASRMAWHYTYQPYRNVQKIPGKRIVLPDFQKSWLMSRAMSGYGGGSEVVPAPSAAGVSCNVPPGSWCNASSNPGCLTPYMPQSIVATAYRWLIEPPSVTLWHPCNMIAGQNVGLRVCHVQRDRV